MGDTVNVPAERMGMGDTDIFSLARHNRLSELKNCFDIEGADPDERDAFGNTILIVASQVMILHALCVAS
jgi:hypothetical protein